MLNIVLLAINAKYVHSSLAVWVIAEGIKVNSQFLHNVSIAEATINQKTSDIVDSVIKYKPDIIGISSYIWNAAMMPELLFMLKKCLPETIIVLGGPEPSNNTEYWLSNGADYVLPGKGEYIFPLFLDEYILTSDNIKPNNSESMKGFCSNSVFIDPYTEDYFNSLNGRLSYIETSRGCPFKCTFCLSASDGIRYFPLDVVKEQITKLSKANTKTIKFVDRTFNCNSERACEIFEYIIALETDRIFHFEVAADLFDDHMFSILDTAPPGRIQFEIGIQSFHEPTLNAISRKTDINEAVKNIRKLVDMQNIHVHIDLIAGLPYESLNDFICGFNRAYSLSAGTLQLGFLKLLHGSILREQANDFDIEYSSKPPYEVTATPWLSNDEIKILKQAENALQHTYNKGRFLSALHYALMTTGSDPFTLMLSLGCAIPNHGIQLEEYIIRIYDHLVTLPGVEAKALQDCLVYDWLGMVKGKNLPAFLKNNVTRRKHIAENSEIILGRKPRREETAVLNSGIGLFTDSNDRDPVTGLYRVYICG